MTRKSYPIDIKKTVFPFGQEYWPNKAEPVNSTGRQRLTDNITALDIKNVLPTPSGYSSFFGTTPLGNLKLPPCTQRVFTYKDSLGNNTLIALGVYGAMFSNDGVNWDTSEVDTVVVQTAVGSYEYRPDMAKNYTGFLKGTATFTKASVLVGGGITELTPATATTDRQDIIVLPVTATNTYHKAISLEVNYDETEVFDRLIEYVNPNFGAITVGDSYVMTTVQEWSSYTAIVGDTVTSVLLSLISLFNSKSQAAVRGVFAEYLSDTKVKIWATSDHTTTALEYTIFYNASGIPTTAPGASAPFMDNGIIPNYISKFPSATKSWVADSTQVTAGAFSLKSDAVANYQSAGVQFTATSNGNLTLKYKVDSALNSAWFKIYIGGIAKLIISGQGGGWVSVSYPILTGQTVWLFYVKASVTAGLDAVWIDELSFPGGLQGSTSLAVLNNDQVPTAIPAATIENLGYVVFSTTDGQPLTDGDFGLYRGGLYQVGGTYTGLSGVSSANDGSLNYTDINLLLGIPYAVPLTSGLLALRQFTGVIQTNLIATLYDSGTVIQSIQLGSVSPASLQRVSCNLVPTDIIVGRVFILQSLGQLGSYTVIVADTVQTVIAGAVAAYNLAGTGVATQHGEQLVTSTATDELYFQPASITTMTASGTNSEYVHVTSFILKNNFVASAELDKLYSLEFNNSVPSTNIIYTIYNDESPVLVTDNLGAWTNANYEITSAQITAAQLAGTKLLVRLKSKHLVVLAKSAGTHTIGGVGFRFRAVLTGNSLMSTHVGPIAGFSTLAITAGVDHYQLYTRNLSLGLIRRYQDIPVTSAFLPVLSPYNELGVASSTGVDVTGLTADVPTTDVFQMSIPVLYDGSLAGNIVDLLDNYTPNTVTVDAIHPITSVLTNIDTSVPMGLRGYLFFRSVGLSLVEQDTFGIFNPWTFGIIKNRLYCYRNGQGAGTYILRLLVDGTAWEQLTPTFANMAQIEGIFEARGRMGMWDTTGSIYTSSVTNPVDFTPSIKTRANVTKVDAVRGNIVLCIGFSDGFIIYSTASIIVAHYVGGTNTFKYTAISKEQGVLNTDAVTVLDKKTQFAYTQAGLYAVTGNGLQDISSEASAYLKSSNLSPRLDYLENRYLSIAFAPTQPSWVVSKWESYSGATIKGIPYHPGSTFPTSPPSSASSAIPKGPYYVTIRRVSGVSFIGFTQGATWYEQAGVNKIVKYTIETIPSRHFYTIASLLDIFSNFIGIGFNPTIAYFPQNGTRAFTKADLLTYNINPGGMFTGDTWASALQWTSGLGYVIGDPLQVPAINGWTGVQYETLNLTLTGSDFAQFTDYLAHIAVQAAIWELVYSSQRKASLSFASISVMHHQGNVYAWGVVYVDDYTGKSEVDGNGDLIPHHEIVSQTPTKIGTSPNIIVSSIITKLYTGLNTHINTDVLNPSTYDIPAFTIPGGQFITTQGTVQNADPIYTRSLILDTQLKNWGSCDIPFRNLLDFIPVNARSFNPTTGTITSNAFTYQNLAKAFAIMLQDGTLNLCTQETTDSVLEFGDIGFTNTGTTRFLDAVAAFTTETGAVLEVLGSRDGETLSPLFSSSALSTNGAAHLYSVLTGKWFRLRITGRFDIKQLTFSGELGGTR